MRAEYEVEACCARLSHSFPMSHISQISQVTHFPRKHAYFLFPKFPRPHISQKTHLFPRSHLSAFLLDAVPSGTSTQKTAESDRQTFKEALPRGSQIYSANGAITSVEMDSLNVPNNDDKCDSNIDNLPMSRRRCARPTNEEQWRVILSQKETREARKRKSVKRKNAQNDEDEDKPTKVFKPYKNRAKKQKL